MRCPKCGYISFDFNQTCPRCSKSISEEQGKINLPSFRPDPPSLLGGLLGETDDSGSDFQEAGKSALDSADIDIELDVSGTIESSDIAGMRESQDFDINLDNDDLQKIDSSRNGIGKFEDVIPDLDFGEEDEELSFDMDELSFDDTDDGSDIDLDLGDIILSEEKGEIPEMGTSAVDSTLEEWEKETAIENQSEIELGLDDLKINETGQLEISSFNIPQAGAEGNSAPEDVSVEGSDEEEDISLDLGDLALDEIPDEEYDTKKLPCDAEIDTDEINFEAETIETEETPDFGDPNLDGEISGDEVLSDLEGITFDTNDARPDSSEQETLLRSEKKKDEIEFDDFDFDLENLDLDLDLDDSEDK